MRHLNFAKAPFRNERLPAVFYGLAVTFLIAVTAIHGVTLTRFLMKEQEELDVKVEALQKEQADLNAEIRRTRSELDSQRNGARTERIRLLAMLYRQKSFSWTGLFNELESLTPASVRITSIAPGPIGGEEDEIQVRLQVVARSLEDIREMVRRLERNRYLTRVLPLSGSEVAEQGSFGATLTLQYTRREEAATAEASLAEEQDEKPTYGNKEEDSAVSQEAVNGQPSAVGGGKPK